MKRHSIYEAITKNIDANGRLNEDFSVCQAFPARNPLTSGKNSGSMHFADGAADGILLYHMDQITPKIADEALLMRAVNKCSDRNSSQADACFEALGASVGAVSATGRLHEFIYSHRTRLNAPNLFVSAEDILFESRNIESVKFALLILEMAGPVREEMREAIRTLGLCDEFTLYAIRDMLEWENGNDEVFELAKKVRGWGRIHAVRFLEPSRPEIKKWLLDEGVDNTVMPDYSALDVWEKAGVGELLKGSVTADEFRKAGVILDALISEGPVKGISGIENREEAVGNYLARAKENELDAADYERILRISKWAALEYNGFDELCADCGDLLASEECAQAIREGLEQGKGLEVAEALEIDYGDSLLKCLEEDFDRQYHNVTYLLRLPDYFGQAIDVFRNRLDLEKMRAEPTKELGFGKENENYMQLDCVVYALADHPCEGEDLVLTCLWAPGMRMRSSALRTLSEWTKALQQPIWEVSPAAYDELKALIEKEVDRELRKRIKALLKGVIPEPEEYENE